jgi:hypothetical protein
MGEDAAPERTEFRIPIEALWLLGDDAQCVISDTAITLCTSIAEVRLTKRDFFVGMGRDLFFISHATPVDNGCIEFAGLGRDASYIVTCPDEATAKLAISRIKAMVGRRIPGHWFPEPT